MEDAGAPAAGGRFSSRPEPGAAVVTAAREDEEEEAAVSTSTDGDEASNAKRGRTRRTIGMPDAAAVLARVSLSCKTEPVEGGEGGGTVGTRRVTPTLVCWYFL